jgi:hypothetical protein
LREGLPTIIIECKNWSENLNLHDGQLLRYFHVSKANFGILTNGIVYRFYTDLVETNKMDEKPFLEFKITEIKDNQIEELKKFHKAVFDAKSITTTASELKYTNELKALIHAEMNNPSPEFVSYFAKQVYPNRLSAKILEQFTVLTKRSTQQYLTDIITERLTTALNKEDEMAKRQAAIDAELKKQDEAKVVTTEEELEAFVIIKSILSEKIPVERITYRDFQGFFAILIDDNIRKPVCRLYLSEGKKSLGLFDSSKNIIRHEIAKLDDIFKFANIIEQTALEYGNKN